MSYSRKLDVIQFQYKIDGDPLERVSEYKDPGVIFDTSLSFNPHIDYVIRSVNKTLCFIIRNSKDFSNKKAMITLYNSFILSKLEYARLIWNPCYVTACESLEKVQRKFLKFMSYKMDGQYPPIGTP
nr:unnamed protein product [Callosobruchus chinensis]